MSSINEKLRLDLPWGPFKHSFYEFIDSPIAFLTLYFQRFSSFQSDNVLIFQYHQINKLNV